MLSNLKTLFDSIKSGLSFSQRRTVLQSDASSSQSEQKHGLDDSISNRHSDSGERFSISRWDSLEGLEEVGHGAFGVVYRAWDPVLRRYVALKLFRADEGQIEEARKLAQVNSPNIVKIFRFETHEGYPGFTMEFIEGLTLADEIEQGAPLDCKAAAAIGIDLCKAVSAVHSAGLLHRDIKAQNVMREANGRIVLMDFGLGENMNNPDVGDSLAGTLPYMAPELFAGARASVSTDVYSLGVLLYFLVSGEYPVSANGISGFRKAHVNGLRVPLRENHRSMNRGFARIVERATAADPSQRFSSAEQLAQALERWRTMRSRKRIWVIVVAPAVAAVVATVFFATRPASIRELRLTHRTTAGISMEPSLSVEGQTVAYESNANEHGDGESKLGDFNIWVKTGETAQRVTDNPTHDTEPTLSPDGRQVAYHSNRKGGGIYIRNIDGSGELQLSFYGHHPKFSPDGTKIVFWKGIEAQFARPSGKIYIVPSAGGERPHQLVSEFQDARHPVWSSDSNEILFEGCGPGCLDAERDSDWWRMSETGASPVNTGALHDALAQGLSIYLGPVSWQHDNIIFSARMEHGTNLFQIPASKPLFAVRRKAVPLMTSTEDAADPAMSRNGVIAFSSARTTVNLYRVPLRGLRGKEEPAPLNRNEEIDSMPSVSADGSRIMYFRRIGNSRRMIVRLIDGTESFIDEVVPQGTRGVIAASGNLIAYSEPGEKGRRVFIRRAQGNSDLPSWSEQIVIENGGEVIDVFDDDRRLLIATAEGIVSLDLSSDDVRSRDISSHNPVLLLQNREASADRPAAYFDQAQVSPDGRWIVFLAIKDADRSEIYVAPMDSERIIEKQWKLVTITATWYDKPRWTRDGRGIVFLSKKDDFVCIWKQQLGIDMRGNGGVQALVHMHRARFSPMYLSRIAFNLSVADDSIFFNAAEPIASIWVAQ